MNEGEAEFMRQFRDRPAAGERYNPGGVQYVDYGGAVSGSPKVVVFVDPLGRGPSAYDPGSIARCFNDRGAALWLSPPVADALGEGSRKHTLRAMVMGRGLGLLAETTDEGAGLWQETWSRVRRGDGDE